MGVAHMTEKNTNMNNCTSINVRLKNSIHKFGIWIRMYVYCSILDGLESFRWLDTIILGDFLLGYRISGQTKIFWAGWIFWTGWAFWSLRCETAQHMHDTQLTITHDSFNYQLGRKTKHFATANTTQDNCYQQMLWTSKWRWILVTMTRWWKITKFFHEWSDWHFDI